jgi:hypothetical protein
MSFFTTTAWRGSSSVSRHSLDSPSPDFETDGILFPATDSHILPRYSPLLNVSRVWLGLLPPVSRLGSCSCSTLVFLVAPATKPWTSPVSRSLLGGRSFDELPFNRKSVHCHWSVWLLRWYQHPCLYHDSLIRAVSVEYRRGLLDCLSSVLLTISIHLTGKPRA